MATRLLLIVVLLAVSLMVLPACGEQQHPTTSAPPTSPLVGASGATGPQDMALSWSQREGDDWADFADGYSRGFKEGCSDLWTAAGGAVYGSGGEEIAETDCTQLEQEPERNVPNEPPDDPFDEGSTLGKADGCRALFESRVGQMFGETGETLTEREVCAGMSRLGPNYRPPPRGGGIPCLGIRTISYPRGVSCGDAETVWHQFSQGGALPSTWACRRARPSERPRIGACSGSGGSFVVEVSPNLSRIAK